VLVVDDDVLVRRLAMRVLGRMGFQVLEAADGIEALEMFENHREQIRVVLCDVIMPRMGGWETLTALRRIDPAIPVILTSGYDEATANAGAHGAAATAGAHAEQADAFLGKPWELKELRTAMAKAIGGPPDGDAPIHAD